MLLVWVATHWPHPPIDLDPVGGDKTAHFVAYGVCGALAAMGWVRSLRHAAAVVAAGGMLAALDEVTQPFFGRRTEAADWIADLIGLSIGLVLAAWWWRDRGPRPVE